MLDALSVGIVRVNDDDTATLTAASNESDVKRRMPPTFPLAGSHAGGCVKSKAHLEVLGTNRLAKSPVFGTIQEVEDRMILQRLRLHGNFDAEQHALQQL